ncbi:MAG TPA: aldehyde dehydrogenase family protein [Gaiellaceae bacterium]
MAGASARGRGRTAELIDAVRREAEAAQAALSSLRDDVVAEALRHAAERMREQRADVLRVNDEDVARAAGQLDGGAIDRLRLDDARLDDAEAQLRAMAELPPLEREIEHWTLDNGLSISTRRIPIGVVGANFEARPGVALDIASQLLKSLNAFVLRTGGAALRTVTLLVDEVLRPALARAGLPPSLVGLVRSDDHAGAHSLVSLPQLVPLVILRGSGATTAELQKVAAAHGVQTLAHAEGGGVLYVDAFADSAVAETIVRASLDRLGVCNRLNLLLVHRDVELEPLLGVLRDVGVEAVTSGVSLHHEWANDADNVASVTVHVVDSLADAVRIANTETSGLAAGIVTGDECAAQAFLDSYRGTAAFWHAPTRFTDGHALTGAPETGINAGWAPGPRGPVTYHDLWLRQVRVIGNGTQHR